MFRITQRNRTSFGNDSILRGDAIGKGAQSTLFLALYYTHKICGRGWEGHGISRNITFWQHLPNTSLPSACLARASMYVVSEKAQNHVDYED